MASTMGDGLCGKAEIVMLAAYGAIAGYLLGFTLNLSFWPFSLYPSSSIAYSSQHSAGRQVSTRL